VTAFSTNVLKKNTLRTTSKVQPEHNSPCRWKNNISAPEIRIIFHLDVGQGQPRIGVVLEESKVELKFADVGITSRPGDQSRRAGDGLRRNVDIERCDMRHEKHEARKTVRCAASTVRGKPHEAHEECTHRKKRHFIVSAPGKKRGGKERSTYNRTRR
jgi:hypothetical protein